MKRLLYLFIIIYLGYQPASSAQEHHKVKKQADTIGVKNLKQVDVKGRHAVKIKTDTLSSSLKLQQPLLEIPQNIVSIPRELLLQQGALELKDAARNASGVYFGYNSTPFDNSLTAQIRGFTAYNTVNGMSRRYSYGSSIDDEALVENIEFIKGPAGFLNSVGEPGGSINIVTKTPGQKLFNVQQTIGSYNMYRTTVDVGSTVKEKGFSYRINGVYQHRNSFLDYLKTDKYVFAPVVQYNFSPNTYVLAEYDLVKGTTKNGSYIGKVTNEADLLKGRVAESFSNAYGLPKSTTQNETGRFVVVHKFDNNWQLTSQSSYLSAPYTSWNLTSKGSVVNFDENGDTKRRANYTLGSGKTFSSQLFLNGKFKTGKIAHQILFGADFSQSKDSLSLNNGIVEFDFNKNHPVDQVDAGQVAKTKRVIRINNDTKLKTAYLYDNIKLQKELILTVGGRQTWYTNDRINTTAKGPGKPQNYDQHAFSPRAALTYLPDSATSVFFLYDQSFVPQSGQRAIVDANKQVTGSEAVDPQRGKDMELGVKRNWFNSRLYTTINGFHTIKSNVLVSDEANPGFVKQIGQVTSKGIEVDILGNITDALSVVANYTYVNAKITKDVDPEQIGKEMPQTPQQIFNTWVQYGFSFQNKARLNLSLGSITQVKRSTSEKDEHLPSFTKFDAGVSYAQGKYFVRFLADNLTGKRYVASGDILNDYPYEGRNYYYIEGEPFNVKLSVGIKF